MSLAKGLFEHKIVNLFLFLNFNICFGCSKEPSHWDGSFEYPQPMFGWWIRKLFLIKHSYVEAYLPEPGFRWANQCLHGPLVYIKKKWTLVAWLHGLDKQCRPTSDSELSLIDDLLFWTPIFGARTHIFWRRLYSFVLWDSHFLAKRALGLLFSKS